MFTTQVMTSLSPDLLQVVEIVSLHTLCVWERVLVQISSFENVSMFVCVCVCTCVCVSASVFLISSYGAPLAHRASYLALHSSLFRPVALLIMIDYKVTNSITSLLIGSRYIPNGTHTNHCWANLAHGSKHIKNSDLQYVCVCIYVICVCVVSVDVCVHVYMCVWWA